MLYRVGRLDWYSIEPSILGTLFERSLDPSKRAQLGTYLTSREDILAVVEPVLVAPLRGRWAEVRKLTEKLAERRDTASCGRATRINNDLSRLLSRYAEEIASVRVLDPACGSGDFLSVSMQNLLNLEKEVIAFARDAGLSGFFPRGWPQQVHGKGPCNLEIGRGFFEGVCGQDYRPLDSQDPPPSIRESSTTSASRGKSKRG